MKPLVIIGAGSRIIDPYYKAIILRAMLGATEPNHAAAWFWSASYDLTLHIAGLSGMANRSGQRSSAIGRPF
jgi:hypothetical protein